MDLRIRRLSPNAVVPSAAHPGDAGLDLHASTSLTIAPGAWATVPTGITIELPPGTEAQVRPRSGLAARHGVTVLNAPGTIDEGYRGEVGVILVNHGSAPFEVTPGARIAQLVVQRRLEIQVVEVDELGHGARRRRFRLDRYLARQEPADMAQKFWLMKVEPSAYTIDRLERDATTSWEGVRNYQTRNFMRDEMQLGDGVLFYASNATPSGVTGLAKIVKAGYPDATAWTKGHHYFDADSREDNPTWFMVDVGFVERFPAVVSLETLKTAPGLEKMVVTQKGSRLSVQPVTKAEYDVVCRLGRKRR